MTGDKNFFKKNQIKNDIIEVAVCCEFWEKVGVKPNKVRKTIGKIILCVCAMVTLKDCKVLHSEKETEPRLTKYKFYQSETWKSLEDRIYILLDSVKVA